MINTIGENVKKYRRKCGYTPRRLAEMVDMDVSILKDIEAGQIIPDPEQVQELATAMREPAHRLYGLPELREPETMVTHYEPLADGELITIKFSGERRIDTVQATKDGVNIILKEVKRCEE